MEHSLKIEKEYIELYKLLKLLGLSESGARAKIDIEEGYVSVDGEVEFRKRCKIRPGQVVQVDDHVIAVS